MNEVLKAAEAVVQGRRVEALWRCCEALEVSGSSPEEVLEALQGLAATYRSRVYDAALERQAERITAARQAGAWAPEPDSKVEAAAPVIRGRRFPHGRKWG